MTTLHPTRTLAWLVLAPFLVVALLGALAPVRAHEGHVHAEAPAAAVRPSTDARAPRVATSEEHELLVRTEPVPAGAPAHVQLLLADATTNGPIVGATLEVTPAGSDSAWSATAIAPGIYDVIVADPARRLDVLVRHGDTLDLLSVHSLATAADTASPAAATRPRLPRLPAWGWIVAALAALGALLGLLRRRGARRAVTLLIIAGLGLAILGSSVARAHDGVVHDNEKEASTGGPTGDRLIGSGSVPAGARYVAKEAQFEIGLRTDVVRAETLAPTRSAFGTVVADPAASASVIAPQTGRFISGRTWRPGDRVRHGQPLGAVLVVDELPVRAPLGGTLATIQVVPGQTVAAGQVIATIVDLSRVRVDLPLYGEALAAGLAARTARVRLAALPDRDFVARVEGLAPATTGGGTGAPLTLSVANLGGILRPGMVVEVTLELPGALPALTVPAAAIVHTEQGPAVFVKLAPEAFTLRTITLGARAGNRVAIAHGVRAGEKVVVAGLAPLLATAEAPR